MQSAPGTAPGTLVADPKAAAPRIRVIAYDPSGYEERADLDCAAIESLARPASGVLWVDVDGLGDIGVIERLGNLFGFHRLALEDVIHDHQRPKAEDYDSHVFVVTHMLVPERDERTEQLSLFFGKGFVVTFQERVGDCFDPVRERLRAGKGRIRHGGADYLAYALIDSVIDSYFPALESCGEQLEELEDAVLDRPTPALVERIHGMKRRLLGLRRAVWPLREVINALARDDMPAVGQSTQIYLRDCYDHTIQLIDMIETYREIASGLVDIYLSSLSTRMNEVMKVLTIIATIFMPLSFLAGLYGMNFDRGASPWNMPELGWPYGYPLVLAAMAGVAGAFVLYFRRRGWIGRNGPD